MNTFLAVTIFPLWMLCQQLNGMSFKMEIILSVFVGKKPSDALWIGLLHI